MAPRNVMPSLFMYAPLKGGVLSPQSVFRSPSYSPPVLAFRTDDEKKESLGSNGLMGFGLKSVLLQLE